ncbi:MAG: HAMP domain-containing sensor histidine kinase [Chloroflexota bacterium]
MSIKKTLKKTSLFTHFSDEALDQLIDLGQTISAAEGDAVCREGDTDSTMYVILDGRLRVFKRNAAGEEVDIDELISGQFFGEMALIDRRPRSATVAAVTPCALFELDRAAFRTLLFDQKTQQMALSVFAELVQRVRSLMERFFEHELNQRTLKAEMEATRLRAIAQMVAGVAHELNTPLGVTNTAVDMIAKRLHNPAVAAALDKTPELLTLLSDMHDASDLALRNIKRANTLVENFKKVSVGQIDDRFATVNLPQLVQDVLDLFRINARRSNLKISFEEDLPLTARSWAGYPGQLTQVLTNLLFNVERYAYPNGKGGPIKINLRAVDGNGGRDPQFELSVSDAGVGISPEHLDQIFTPFFTTGRSRGGTGLGLAIVHNIVSEALGGRIEVTSAPDQGTTFTILFPQTVSQ